MGELAFVGIGAEPFFYEILAKGSFGLGRASLVSLSVNVIVMFLMKLKLFSLSGGL